LRVRDDTHFGSHLGNALRNDLGSYLDRNAFNDEGLPVDFFDGPPKVDLGLALLGHHLLDLGDAPVLDSVLKRGHVLRIGREEHPHLLGTAFDAIQRVSRQATCRSELAPSQEACDKGQADP
jgi:hypothetical protein